MDRSSRLLTATVALLLGLAVVAAQQVSPGTHPVSGRRFAPVMGYPGADWLERAERIAEEEPDVALNLLQIPKGASVADIGAGSGYITVRLARRVGAGGRVYANDLQPQMLELLQRRIAREKITNVTIVQGAVAAIPARDAVQLDEGGGVLHARRSRHR